MGQDSKCGICGIYPKWLQNFATSRSFIAVYGFLGTVQSMAFIYMTVSLTTLEKRFKISSQTTGIILSGNEITEFLSILLIYYGGSAHRPRWIAIGVALSAVSCLILALPHFLYGSGQDALALTQEYFNSTFLIVLGIGTTLYYGLGQPYMDDNSKKKNMPIIFGFTFALRTVGPAIAFVFSYFFMNLYINPTLHPLIDKNDPRWLGAWWLGWIVLGFMQGLFALLLALFPQELQKSKSKNEVANLNESEAPLKIAVQRKNSQNEQLEKPTLKDFPATIKRIVTNKLLMINTFSAVFYVLSYAPFLNFFAKYIEVQFNTSSAAGTIISGPFTLVGMVFGFLISGFVISKFKPSPRLLMYWNILMGSSFVTGHVILMFISCNTNSIEGLNLDTTRLNLTSSCNTACNCEHVKFSPVCHEVTETTFFSACHAGCQKIINGTIFDDCNCISNSYWWSASSNQNSVLEIQRQSSSALKNSATAGPCKQDCFKSYMIFSIVSTIINILSSSGRIGSVLINYRCVETRDKGLAQGIGMMFVSLFALIPGPILYGAIIDSTCLVWDYSCKHKGNCWVYHKDNFRYYAMATNAGFGMIAVCLDMLVCYYSKSLDLYGEQEESQQKKLSNFKNNDNINDDEDSSLNL